MINILLLADTATLDNLELLISAVPGFRILEGQARSARIDTTACDMVIAGDASTPDMSVCNASGQPPLLIRVSDDPLQAVNAFTAGAVDFLLKPLEPERLAQALRRAATTLEALHARMQLTRLQTRLGAASVSVRTDAPKDLWIQKRGASVRLPWSEVRWIEADGDYVLLHAQGGDHHVRRSITTLARELQPDFVRVHRSALVRRTLIRGAERHSTGAKHLLLADGLRVPLGRSYACNLAAAD